MRRFGCERQKLRRRQRRRSGSQRGDPARAHDDAAAGAQIDRF
jgi:hypothetical protein